MTDEVTSRVRYFDGQFLGVGDFQDEQDYHLGQQRRHNISGHTWGIVGGLEVTATPRAVQVGAGSAVDVLGRVIVLAHPTTLQVPEHAQTVNVWIRHEETVHCESEDACGVLGVSRVQERGRVVLDVNLDPPDSTHELPLDDARHAHVFLGRVELDPLRPDEEPVVRVSGRRWTGLVGSRVDAPSGAAALRLSGGTRGGGPAKFEVLAAAGGGEASADPDGDEPALTPALTVSGAGRATFAGDLAVEGALTLDGDRLVFGALPVQTDPESLDAAADRQPTAAQGLASASGGPQSTGGADPAPAPQPWSVRQVAGPPPRLEVVLPAHDPTGTELPATFSIGTWSADANAFVPLLVVHADGNVDVPGTLRVGGLAGPDGQALHEGAVVDGGLGPEAKRMVTAAAMSGTAGASGIVAALVQPSAAPQAGPLGRVLGEVLDADRVLTHELAASLRTAHPQLAAVLAALLQDGS